MTQLTITKPTMTSIEIAEMTDKRHDNVLRDIENIAMSLTSDLSSGLQSTTYTDKSGKPNKMYVLDEDTTLLLVTGYDVTARMKVIKRWKELEAKQAQALPQTRIEAVRAYLHTLEELEASERLVASQMTSIQVLDRAVEDKKVITNESSQYLSVQRVKELNPTIKLSGRKLSRKSEDLGLPPVPLFSNYGMNSPMTYHSKVWVTVYPTIRLP